MADTTGITLVQTRIAAGIWEGVLDGANAEAVGVAASHAGRDVEGVETSPIPGKPGQYGIRVPIPAWALNEGVQTFVLRMGEVTLGQFTLIAGVPLEEDLRAEISLLRAELDLLKRAFQRHCRETGD